MNYEFAVQYEKECEYKGLEKTSENMHPFLIYPPTNTNKVYMCFIKREKGEFLHSDKYKLYLQLGGENIYILTAKRKTNLIRQTIVIFPAINQITSDHLKNPIGKIKASGHQFVTSLNPSHFPDSQDNNDIVIVYNSKLFSSWKPYQMKITFVHPFATFGDKSSIQSKTPIWDPIMKTHVLDFHSRVTIPSIKNFQLETDESDIIMQFGRVGRNTFTMDFKYPLSLFQAFCIALTRFVI